MLSNFHTRLFHYMFVHFPQKPIFKHYPIIGITYTLISFAESFEFAPTLCHGVLTRRFHVIKIYFRNGSCWQPLDSASYRRHLVGVEKYAFSDDKFVGNIFLSHHQSAAAEKDKPNSLNRNEGREQYIREVEGGGGRSLYLRGKKKKGIGIWVTAYGMMEQKIFSKTSL